MKRFYLILKFFITTGNGKLRVSFLYPMIGILIGSYCIFITFSIMHGMQNKINENLNIFEYKYKSNSASYSNILNEGNYRSVILNKNNSDVIVKLKFYSNFNNYYKRVDKKLLFERKDFNEVTDVIIGKGLADNINLHVGDSIYVSFPAEINIITKNIPGKYAIINNIYNIDVLDYNDKYIVSSMQLIEDVISINDLNQYSDVKIDNTFTENLDNNLLINAIAMEKRIYTILGYLLIFISSIMMFNLMVVVLIDKSEQLKTLTMLGLTKKNQLLILIIKNSFVSIILSFIGYCLSEVTIYLNYKYQLFRNIFDNMPFEILPMELTILNVVFLLILINIITISSGTLPAMIKTK